MHIDLTGKTIFITGASRGLGKAIAWQLLESGAFVILHCNRHFEQLKKELLESGFAKYYLIKCDLSIESEVEIMAKSIIKDFPELGGVVLNAGVFKSHQIDSDIEEWKDVWKNTMQVNLNAPALLSRYFIPLFKKNRNGRFVFVASRAAFRGETSEYLAYAASKGGLISFGRSIARSFGKSGIKAFMLAPGFVDTDMAQSFSAIYGQEKILNELALNELTKPEDISPLVCLLLSGKMDHATGSTIDINAGSHIR